LEIAQIRRYVVFIVAFCHRHRGVHFSGGWRRALPFSTFACVFACDATQRSSAHESIATKVLHLLNPPTTAPPSEAARRESNRMRRSRQLACARKAAEMDVPFASSAVTVAPSFRPRRWFQRDKDRKRWAVGRKLCAAHTRPLSAARITAPIAQRH
jgi:hypothetical protein